MPIRSRRYLDGSRGQPCSFAMPGICNGDADTVVFAHLNGAEFGKGMGQKADDIAGLDACQSCHAYIDIGHGTRPAMSDGEFWRRLARGVVATIANRVERGIVVMPLDAPRTKQPKPRKPRADRAKIPARKAAWPKRQMQSRNDLKGRK